MGPLHRIWPKMHLPSRGIRNHESTSTGSLVVGSDDRVADTYPKGHIHALIGAIELDEPAIMLGRNVSMSSTPGTNHSVLNKSRINKSMG